MVSTFTVAASSTAFCVSTAVRAFSTLVSIARSLSASPLLRSRTFETYNISIRLLAVLWVSSPKKRHLSLFAAPREVVFDTAMPRAVGA